MKIEAEILQLYITVINIIVFNYFDHTSMKNSFTTFTTICNWAF